MAELNFKYKFFHQLIIFKVDSLFKTMTKDLCHYIKGVYGAFDLDIIKFNYVIEDGFHLM